MANRYRGGMYVGGTAGALAREELVKRWRREWKFALIEAENPDWDDVWEQWFAPQTERK